MFSCFFEVLILSCWRLNIFVTYKYSWALLWDTGKLLRNSFGSRFLDLLGARSEAVPRIKLIIPYTEARSFFLFFPVSPESWGFPGWLLGTGTVPGPVWAPSPLILLGGSLPALGSFLTHMHWADVHSSLCAVFSLVFCPKNSGCLGLPRLLAPFLSQGACWTLRGPFPVMHPRDSPIVGLNSFLSCLSDIVVLCFLMFRVLKRIVSCHLFIFLVVLYMRVNLVLVDWLDCSSFIRFLIVDL